MKTYTKEEFSDVYADVYDILDSPGWCYPDPMNGTEYCCCVAIVRCLNLNNPQPEDLAWYVDCPNCLGQGVPPIPWSEVSGGA
jgi:hypothetical protein